MIDRLIIKEAMKRNGTSVNEVANKMGISRVTLSTHINTFKNSRRYRLSGNRAF